MINITNKYVDIHDALRWAAARGHLDIVKYLVSKGANMHDCHKTTLRGAASNGHLDIVKYLESIL